MPQLNSFFMNGAHVKAERTKLNNSKNFFYRFYANYPNGKHKEYTVIAQSIEGAKHWLKAHMR